MKLLHLSTAALIGVLPMLNAQGGFYEQCEPSTFSYELIITGDYVNTPLVWSAWLSGDCLAPDGSYTNSSLSLSTCITNDNGQLEVSGFTSEFEMGVVLTTLMTVI